MKLDFAALFFIVPIGAWMWSIATDQAGKLFDRRGPDAVAWYWLRAMRVQPTRDNCTRFANVIQVAGIVLLFAVMLAVWLSRG